MSSPLIHVEVVGKDAKKLQGFFGDLFGWQINADNPMNYGMVNLSGDVGGGIGPAPEGQPGHAMFYVGVDDVEAALQKAESLGGSRAWGPMDVPEGPT
ncbi:MAG TPA: VOC family protein, partial [Thermoleophilaceae bacterium]|nr:VOC family protein [Thermoleophilaceae bacterium]